MHPSHIVQKAYAHCLAISQAHYENFPVASSLLPARLRQPISAIYAFARTADDIADEGDASRAERLAALSKLEHSLLSLDTVAAPPDEPILVALQDSIHRHHLSFAPFQSLLSAFRQDCELLSYANFPSLLDYCSRSANPVGRLLLQLCKVSDEKALNCSDDFCTALQLLNFWQDLADDIAVRGRCYLPQDELASLQIVHWPPPEPSLALEKLVEQHILFAVSRIHQAKPLLKLVPLWLSLELRLMMASALCLSKLLLKRKSVWSRPTLKIYHGPQILLRALRL